jgi:rubrerythrin
MAPEIQRRVRRAGRERSPRETFAADHRATSRAGEAELMWRCWGCGEMGRIEALPDACPDCDSELYYELED